MTTGHQEADVSPIPRQESIRAILVRALLMTGIAIMFGVSEAVLLLIAIVQIGWLIATGTPNERLASFGASLSTWFAESARFQCCVTEEKPFPWKSWPKP